MKLEFIEAFQQAMHRAGITPPATLQDDGRIHRFATGKKAGDKAGWYVLYGDGLPAGSFGDWRLGVTHSWRAHLGRALTPLETVEYQEKMETIRVWREAEEEKRAARARQKAQWIWEQASPASSNHPYLLKKGIEPHGIREYQGDLVVPIEQAGVLQSLQFIKPNGHKRFLAGGMVKGGYFKLGEPREKCCICEGYATGVSIFMATGYGVMVAFNTGNLIAVAKRLRTEFPNLPLVICADDDCETAGNPGLTQAQAIAVEVDGLLAVPDFGDHRTPGMSDFNDMHQQAGAEAVKSIIDGAKPIDTRWGQPDEENQSGVQLTCALDLKPEPIQWLWQDWLALGKFHLLAGSPGTGKTTLALNLAAIITQGYAWPDGTHCAPGNVLIWSGEDNHQDILLPRLLAHGGDQARVYFIGGVHEDNKARSFDPAVDLPKLREKAARMREVKLIIIDPVVNVVSCDSHKNGEVRRALQPLVELGNQLKAVILGISHFSKGTMGRDPLERVTGSIAFGALARIVLATTKITDLNGDIKRLLVRAKSNYGPDGGGYHYQIQPTRLETERNILASQILWGEPIEGSAQALLTDISYGVAEERSTLAEAIEFLKVLLADGPLPKKEIADKGKEAGFKEITLRRAKAFLRIQAIHEGYGAGSVWKWHLPSKMIKNPKGAHTFKVSRFENHEQV